MLIVWFNENEYWLELETSLGVNVSDGSDFISVDVAFDVPNMYPYGSWHTAISTP